MESHAVGRIGASSAELAALPFGATVRGDGTTSFRVWAADAQNAWVEIAGRPPIPLQPVGGGWFEVQAPAPPGTLYRYKFVTPNRPDGILVPDPASRAQAGDVHGQSVVVDPGAYHWQEAAWRGRPWHEFVVYEVHVGALGGFAGVMARLPELAALGVTAVELMPIAEFPGPRNWGYDGVLPFAPDAAYGTPESLKGLVDAAHRLGVMVFLDVVYNHFGPDGNYLGAYASGFYRHDQTTPWGDAIDFRRPEVQLFFIESALYWLNEYRFDGLRFDAVHMIRDFDFLRMLARDIRARVARDRHVHLIVENEDNAAALLRTGPDAPGFDAQWADDLHHCLHVLLTGESEAYYEDFVDAPAAKLARCLAEGFAYQGDPSLHAGGTPRGEPSGELPPTAFVICLQNHDQIGNRAMGERLTVLADHEALRAAVALLLLVPQIPMLFMGEEWGTTRPFLYFTSHSDGLAEQVRLGRRKEFAKFAAFTDPARREQIPDPNALATFEQSCVDPAEVLEPGHAAWLEHYRSLLRIRTEQVILRIPGSVSAGAEALGDKAVLARWRMGDGSLLSVAMNLDTASCRCAPLAGRVLFASTAAAGDAARGGGLLARCTVATLQELGA